jgi:eukaryotic-like serine/threonine-protein kinase
VAELKKCRACGVDVQSNAPFRHCPGCLLELGFVAMPKGAMESSAQSTIPNPQSANKTVRYFGDYELLEQIGHGGMGIVYKARQQSLNRIVALKMISAGEFASPSAVQRFQIEAEAAGKLDHPNIVPIYEIGVHRGQHYFSMKFVEGCSLAEAIRHGEFQIASGGRSSSKSTTHRQQLAVARLMATVARSVHYAHQHGVLHRDLKPSNILLDGDGQPHLTDFGLAKILEHEVGITQSNQVMGTPSYMSPEQAAGRDLTVATDIYSAGGILFELLTGKPPFHGQTAIDVLQQVTSQDPPNPRWLNPLVNSDLATICLKCLDKDPLRRYDSAGALAADLENWGAERPIMARPVSAREKFWRLCRRNPVPSTLAAAVLLLLSVVAITATVSAVKISASKKVLHGNLYVAEMNVAFQEWEAGHIARARELLARQLPRPTDQDLRGFEWRLLSGLARPQEHAILGGTNRSVWGVKFSPDNRLVAGGLLDGKVIIWNASTGEELGTLEGHHAVVDTLAFSPDGQFLASASRDRTIRLWNVASHQLLRTFSGHRQQTFWVAFSPDGKTLASTAAFPYATAPGEVKLWDVATGGELCQLRGAESWICRAAWSRDGKHLAVAAGNGSVLVWELETKQLLKRWRGHTGFAVSVQFSPDGKQLATCGEDGRVRLWRWDAAEPLEMATFPGHEGTVFDLAFSPDGKLLASGGVDHMAKLWDIKSKRLLRTYRGHSARILCLDFAGDGRTFATGSPDGTVRLWRVNPEPEDKPLIEHLGGWAQVWFSPDSAVIGHVAHRTVTLFETETKRELARLNGQTASFSPDSKLLAVLKSNSVELMEPRTWKPIASMAADRPLRAPMVFAPDSRFLAVPSRDNHVIVFDVQRRGQIGMVPGTFADGYHLPTAQLTFSADGKTLFATDADSGSIRLWDFPTLRPAGTLQGHTKPVYALATDHGSLLASGGDDATVRLWDWRRRSLVAELRPEAGWVWSVAFSPDGKTLACGTMDGWLVFWNVATGQQITRLKAHSNAHYFMVFSKDGRHLATTSFDGTTRLWSAPSMTELASSKEH